MARRCALGLVVTAALAGPATLPFVFPAAIAREAPELGNDPAIEHHMMRLAATLRCLQCQNQTLAASEAPLAVDLRQQIRELLAKGETDAQVRAYLVARYGNFVLYRPPVQDDTILLWFGPGLLLVGGLVLLYITLKRRAAAPPAMANDAGLSAEDTLRAHRLLEQDAGEESSHS